MTDNLVLEETFGCSWEVENTQETIKQSDLNKIKYCREEYFFKTIFFR